MNKTFETTKKIKKLVGLAILSAIIIVLQCFCSVLTIPGLNVAVTLTLVPILVGAIMYGVTAGAFLGAVFGLVVLLTDPTAAYLMTLNSVSVNINAFSMNLTPVATAVLCIGKGALAGAAAGLVYKLSYKRLENQLLSVIFSGIVAPIVNTGCFVLGMLLFFKDTIYGWASGSSSFIYYVIIGLCGINFVVELCVNLALSAGIVTIVNAVKQNRKN